MKIAIAILAIVIAFVIGYNQRPVYKITHPTDYYFNVDSSGYDIYTEDMKIVGRLTYKDNPTLDSLIDKDNE